MNCREFEQHVRDRLIVDVQGRLDPSAAKHAAKCRSCAAYFADITTLGDRFEAVREAYDRVESPSVFDPSAVQDDRRVLRPRVFRFARAGMAAAAVLAAAMLIRHWPQEVAHEAVGPVARRDSPENVVPAVDDLLKIQVPRLTALASYEDDENTDINLRTVGGITVLGVGGPRMIIPVRSYDHDDEKDTLDDRGDSRTDKSDRSRSGRASA